MSKIEWCGSICVGIGIIGWLAIVLVAVAFPGGHPPLSAYVSVPIIIVLFPINVIGAVMGLMAVNKGKGIMAIWRNGSALLGNIGLLVLGVLSIT